MPSPRWRLCASAVNRRLALHPCVLGARHKSGNAGAMWGRLPACAAVGYRRRSEEHTSELQSLRHLVCRLLLEKNWTERARERPGDGPPVRPGGAEEAVAR